MTHSETFYVMSYDLNLIAHHSVNGSNRVINDGNTFVIQTMLCMKKMKTSQNLSHLWILFIVEAYELLEDKK